MRRPLFLAIAGTATSLAAFGAYRYAVRPWYESWGVDPVEKDRLLPGDELLAAPVASETRGITIEAPAAAIWPWIVQMGYGRGGWYSYDGLDMKGRSATTIVPEWQSITAGGTMPTDPNGGFEIAQVEPDHALVLYLDDKIVRRRRAAAEADERTEPAEKLPAGLAVSGAILGGEPTAFKASWALVLEPIDGGRTRLIERARVEHTPTGFAGGLTTPLIGFGMFVMMRRQMLGLKERAEGVVHEPHAMEVAPLDEMTPADVHPAPKPAKAPKPGIAAAEPPLPPEAAPTEA
jgi:hypothetical protein